MNDSLYEVLQQYEPDVTAACVDWQQRHKRRITEKEYGNIVESFVMLMLELNRRGAITDSFDPMPAIDQAIHYVLDIGFKQQLNTGDK